MTIDLTQLNWLAILVAAFATFMLGGAWYTALFGKLWVKLHGFSEAKIAQMKRDKPPAMFFGIMIISYLVLAIVIAVLVTSFNLSGAGSGAMLGFLLWLGPAAAIGMTSYIASDRPFGVYAIDLSYQLVFLVMMGVIIAAWR